MAEAEHSRLLEALLLMATEPVATATLAAQVDLTEEQTEAELVAIAEFYRVQQRGFELRRAGAGWRFATCADLADAIAEAVVLGQPAKLSQAALETLAVVAYLQPVTRGRISAIRGVSVDAVVRTLVARGLIAEAQPDSDAGQAARFVTTDYFTERMGITSLDELPDLAPYLPDASVLEAELAQTGLAEAALSTNTTEEDDEPQAR